MSELKIAVLIKKFGSGQLVEIMESDDDALTITTSVASTETTCTNFVKNLQRMLRD